MGIIILSDNEQKISNKRSLELDDIINRFNNLMSKLIPNININRITFTLHWISNTILYGKKSK